MSLSDTYSFVITCARGFESHLSAELTQIGLEQVAVVGGAVSGRGSFETAMKICLWSRLANKVEVLLGDCYALNDHDIYELGRTLPLEPWFRPENTFCVRAHSSDAKFKNTMFLALKLKDGIVDHMREAWGQRASIDTQCPDLEIALNVSQRRARVCIELQGAPLNMRGYRRRQLQAPIRETLAASMIAVSEWTPDTTFVDPMCGSGTFVIEAALQAVQTAPGIQRHFAFEKLPFFSDYSASWRAMRDHARETSRQARKNRQTQILAFDIDENALDIAQNNAQTAGVSEFIRFSKGSVLDVKHADCVVVTNPPYGERISVAGYDLPEFYYQLGRHVRTFERSSLTIISSAELLKKNMHMKPDLRIPTFNGPLSCEVARYSLGKGSK